MPIGIPLARTGKPPLNLLADPLIDEDFTVEELVNFALAGLPEPFDPEGRLAPQERCLGSRLIDEGFQPTNVARLDVEEGGLWEIRIVDTPDLATPAAARTLKRRLRRAIMAASVAPLIALTEVYGRPGFRRFVFSTRVQQAEEDIALEDEVV